MVETQEKNIETEPQADYRKRLRNLSDRQRRVARVQRRKAMRQKTSSPASKINNVTATFLIIVALIIDGVVATISLLHFIPAIGNVLAIVSTILINIFAWLTFYVWLKIKGVNLISPKKAAAMLGAGFVGFIPIINILPGWTLAMTVVIIMEKKESIPVLSKVPVKTRSGT